MREHELHVRRDTISARVFEGEKQVGDFYLMDVAEYAVAAYNICRRSGLPLNVLQDHLTTLGAIEHGSGREE